MTDRIEDTPLLGDEQIDMKFNFMCYPHGDIAAKMGKNIRDIYEKSRKEDMAQIEALVDALTKTRHALSDLLHHGVEYPETGERHQADPDAAIAAIALASAALLSIHPNT